MRTSLVLAGVIAVVGCGGSERPAPRPAGPPAAHAAFDAEVERFYTAHLAFRPQLGIETGQHAYDGQVPDRSPAALDAEVARLRAARATFEGLDGGALDAPRRLDREIVLAEIRKELFDLEVRRRPWRDPFWYLRGFSLAPYVARPYAPVEERAAALLRACRGGGAYYDQVDANLEASLPRAWLQVGIRMTEGMIAFVEGVPAALGAPAGQLASDIEACAASLAGELKELAGALKARMPAGRDEFAIGGDAMLTMLREAEGIDTDLATLERLARADLERNQAAIAEAARAIDPSRDVREVVAEVSGDKPAADQVLDTARAQLAELRAYVEAREIVSLPRDELVEVQVSPPYMRGNFAALGGVGAFETARLASFYYIAPPDPSWPPAEQLAYLPSRWDLLFTSAHEVWPGHFVQGMHQRAHGSKVMRTFETYTTSEGWAHYVEEMMWDAGLGDGDPRARIGMLKNALLRDVRFLVALGLHTGGMTVEQATAMFAEHAFADPGNARQQAMRGTLDPMFLGYTLGKLAIRKLRDDHQRATGAGWTLRGFHDAFLAHGEAPLPAIRASMLGEDAGPVL